MKKYLLLLLLLSSSLFAQSDSLQFSQVEIVQFRKEVARTQVSQSYAIYPKLNDTKKEGVKLSRPEVELLLNVIGRTLVIADTLKAAAASIEKIYQAPPKEITKYQIYVVLANLQPAFEDASVLSGAFAKIKEFAKTEKRSAK